MAEQALSPVKSESKGKIYWNLNLKPKEHKGIAGLENGNWITVKKSKYVEGQVYKSPTLLDYQGNPLVSFSCQVEYNGQDVSFWLNQNEHTSFKNTGGIGDSVRITLNEVKKVNPKTGAKSLVPMLVFEKV